MNGPMLSWTVTVNASNRVGHPLKDVCSCWQEFGGIQWRSHRSSDVIVFRLNKEYLGRQGLSPLQAGHWFETREGYAANSPHYFAHLQGVYAAEVRVTNEPNYGVCCGEIDSQWGCFSLHIAVGPPFNVPFQWPQVSVLNSLHLRFLSLYCPNALLPKET
jgi:hypothetical protein